MLHKLYLTEINKTVMIISAVFALIGLLLILLTTGHSFMGMAFIFCGAMILFYSWCTVAVDAFPVFIKTFRMLVTIVFIICLAYFSFVESFIIRDAFTEPQEEPDFIIVLGAGVNGSTPSLSLRDRLNGTYEYMIEHPNCVVIVSGGQGPGEDLTEALCMKNWLTEKGISEHRIIMEDQATCTLENLRYSIEIIDAQGIDDPIIGLLSSEYHMHRAKYLADYVDLDVVGIPARTSFPTVAINYFIREAFAMTELYVFGAEGI